MSQMNCAFYQGLHIPHIRRKKERKKEKKKERKKERGRERERKKGYACDSGLLIIRIDN